MLEIDSETPFHDDLHCHLLPDWDDGPKSLDASIEMARRAYASGIRRILVTPHVGKSFGAPRECRSPDIPSATHDLQNKIQAQGIDISLTPGAEVTLTGMEMVARIGAEPWLTVGGQNRYVLVETPMGSWPASMEHLFFEISLRGITPILAHPERIVAIQRDIGIARAAVSRGVVLQLTARSLMATGRVAGASECARRLLDAGLVSIVASDAHSAKSVLPSQVAGVLAQGAGPAAAQLILSENPRRILEGQAVQLPVPISLPPRRKGMRAIVAAIAKPWA